MKYSEVTHFTHKHILKPESNETPYTCDGCKEPGWGLRFRCEECNYDLHKDCALGASSTTRDFYTTSLKLLKRGPADTCCSACGKLALGLVYYGGGRSLHPCCAALPPVLLHEKVELHLEECVHTTTCCRCGKRNLWGQKMGWSYRSSCKNYHFHVSCVKDMVKDLVMEKWEREKFCTGMDIGTVVPDLLLTCGNFSSSRRAKLKQTSLNVVEVVLNIILSTILGDPLGVTLFFESLLTQ